MKSNVCLVIQRVHFCLQQLLTCMNVGTHSTVCKTKTNAPLVHTLHTRMQSLVKKEWVSESKKWKWPFWRISLASEPLGFQNLHKVISHNTGDNKHWVLLTSVHPIFNINTQLLPPFENDSLFSLIWIFLGKFVYFHINVNCTLTQVRQL